MHRSFLPNSFQVFVFAALPSLALMLSVHSDIKKFSIGHIIHYSTCHLPLYTVYM